MSSSGERIARAALIALAIAWAPASSAWAQAAPSKSKAPPSQSQEESRFHLKPGAAGKVCLDCHSDFQDVMKRPFVHTPVKTGQCIGCHSPHAAEHGKLLAASPDEVCATCHEKMIPEGAASVHQA